MTKWCHIVMEKMANTTNEKVCNMKIGDVWEDKTYLENSAKLLTGLDMQFQLNLKNSCQPKLFPLFRPKTYQEIKF